jgi:hypothetical protein
MNEDIFDLEINEKAKISCNEIPDIVKTRIEETLATLPKKRSFTKIISAASVAVVLIFSFSFVSAYVSPAMAKALRDIPILGSVFSLIGDNGLKNASDLNLTKIEPQTVTDKGISITITDAIYDGSRISFGYMIESNNGIQYQLKIHESYDPYIDGKFLNAGAESVYAHLQGNKYIGTEGLSFEQKLPDKFTLGIKINKLFWDNNKDEKSINGNWNFDIPLTVVKQGVINKAFNPMLSKIYKDTKIYVKSLYLSPATSTLNLEVYGAYSLNLDFNVFTDRGILVDSLGGSNGTYGSNSTHYYQLRLSPLKTKPSYLVLKPLFLYESQTQELGSNYPLKIFERHYGSFYECTYLNNIEFNPDKTLLKIKGHAFNIDSFMPISIKDESGKEYFPINTLFDSTNKPDSYTLVFPAIDKNQKLEINSPKLVEDPEILKQMEIKIPLN